MVCLESLDSVGFVFDQIVGYSSLALVKAKFHYAIMVADRSEAGRRPAAS